MVAAIVAKQPRVQTVPANKSPKGMIRKQWLSRFLDRHPELASRFAGRIDNQSFVDYAQAHKIGILCSPDHSTHLLEPLDVTIFAPLGTCYRNEVDVWTRTHPYQSIKKGDFFPMSHRARRKLFTKKNNPSPFAKGGIHPFLRRKILDLVESVTPEQATFTGLQTHNPKFFLLRKRWLWPGSILRSCVTGHYS
jgi:hypothetical protein